VTEPLEHAQPPVVDLSTSLAELIDDADAYAAVIQAISRVDEARARDFARETMWIPNRPLVDAFSAIAPAPVRKEVELGLQRLSASRDSEVVPLST